MDPDTSHREIAISRPIPQRQRGSRARRNEAWNRHKDEIRKFYLLDDHSLPSTMELFERKYALEACTRSWKAKLKEWKFEKYLTAHEKTFMITRTEKRKRDEGKETTFFHFHRRIDTAILESFPKSKSGKAGDVASPVCSTPEYISYRTPSPQKGARMTEDRFQEMSWEIAKNTQHPPELAAPMDSETMSEPDRLCHMDAQSPLEYAANLLNKIAPFDKSKSKREVAEWRAMVGYEASLVQRSIVDRNLEFLEAAYSDGRVRVKVHGLTAEGSNPDGELVWAVSRSPLNTWCHGCLRIIGAGIRYACSICPAGDGSLYYCSSCYNNGEGSCFSQDHQLHADESLLDWECKKEISRSVETICNIDDCGKRIEGIFFHCCICCDDDFVICLQCVAKGRGCGDVGHTLELAVSTINPLIAPRKKATEGPWAR